MAETREQALERARRLLALGGSSNEHEAANALAAAQRIIDDWKLEQALLEQDVAGSQPGEDPIDDWDEPLELGRRRVTWKGQLAAVLARVNACQVYWSRALKDGHDFVALKVIGHGGDAATVRYLYAYCVREIDRLARKYPGKGRTWLNNYRLGCVDAIRNKLHEMQRERREQLERTGGGTSVVRMKKALARLDERQDEVRRWIAENMRLYRGGAVRFRSDASGRAAGQRDGRSIQLDGGRGAESGTRTIRGRLGQ